MPKTPNETETHTSTQNTKLPTYIMMTGDIFPLQALHRHISIALLLPFHSNLLGAFSFYHISSSNYIIRFGCRAWNETNICYFYAMFACARFIFFYRNDKLIWTSDNQKMWGEKFSSRKKKQYEKNRNMERKTKTRIIKLCFEEKNHIIIQVSKSICDRCPEWKWKTGKKRKNGAHTKWIIMGPHKAGAHGGRVAIMIYVPESNQSIGIIEHYLRINLFICEL